MLIHNYLESVLLSSLQTDKRSMIRLKTISIIIIKYIFQVCELHFDTDLQLIKTITSTRVTNQKIINQNQQLQKTKKLAGSANCTIKNCKKITT